MTDDTDGTVDALGDVLKLNSEPVGHFGAPSAPHISGVMVECKHGSLPFAQTNAGHFIQTLKKELSLDPTSSLGNFLSRVDLSEISLKQLDDLIPINMEFEDGSLKIKRDGKEDYIQIPAASFSAPSVLNVSVYGNSADAEAVLGKVYECLNSAAGLNRQWAEGKKTIGFQKHTTISLETLNCGLGNVLSKGLADSLIGAFKDESGLLANIGSLQIDPETLKPHPKKYIGAVKLEELQITVTRIDPTSGSTDKSTLRVSPHTKVDAGRGTYTVASALPYDEHIEFVKLLKSSLA